LPSLRARIVKNGLVSSLKVLRSRGGGVPDPMGPVEDLERYALAIRNQMEALGARRPAPRGATMYDADGAPVRGLWVVDDRARTRPGLDDPIRETDRVILHLHGGAYCMGSPMTHRGLGAALSRTGRAAVLLPDYRLAPEHPFPAALDDARSAYRWLTEDRGVDPDRMAVVGDSAGGGLAAALLLRLRDDGEPLPACYAGLSPWMDLAGTAPSMEELDGVDPWLSAAMVSPAARAYAGDRPLDDPLVSPLYGDLTGFPPTLVHVGSDEILRDDAIRFVHAAREHGVDASLGLFDGLWHVFQAFPGVPETRASLREIGAFVRRHTSDAHERASA
jgi:epsilon-lactone hydrolase